VSLSNLRMGSGIVVCFQVVLFLLLSLGHLWLGGRVLEGIERRWGAFGAGAAARYLLGLLLHLTLAFFFVSAGGPWLVATFLPTLLALLQWRVTRKQLSACRIPAHPHFLLWFTVIFALGLSLIQAVNGIATPWANNYGDFAFHMGMISSFAFGDNIPPQYHIYPGVRLSYPFLLNFWAAMLWRLTPDIQQLPKLVPDYQALPIILALQWTVCWSLVYHFCQGNRFWLLPWAILLGGGSFFALGNNSGPLISAGYPWTSFLTTIWVPQRTSVGGLVVLLAAVTSFHRWRENRSLGRGGLILSGFLLGLSPIVHTHFFLVGCGYIGVSLVSLIPIRAPTAGARASASTDLLAWGAALLPCVLFIPWLIGKADAPGDMGKLMWGWMVPPIEGQGQLKRVVDVWLFNAAPWFAVVGIFWLVIKRHRELLVLSLLFVGANLVQLAFWDWDQIKLFLGIYVVSLALWTTTTTRLAWMLHLLCVVLMVPTTYECTKLFAAGDMSTVYSKEDLVRAAQIVATTPPDAIMLAKPNHNSIVTLTGRKLFIGYDGTLWSHGIPYEARRPVLSDLTQAAECDPHLGKPVCATYLVWTEVEQEQWHRPLPGSGFEGTPLSYLYTIKRN